MKICRLISKTLFLAVLSFTFSSFVCAQKTALPSGLTEKSSLEEILKWLDETSFSQAVIGLESNVSEPEPNGPTYDSDQYYEQAFFTKGFRLAKIDGCRLTLRNDNTEFIRFETKYPNPSKGSLTETRNEKIGQPQFISELSIPLQKIKANKSPFLHTKKTENSDLLGIWRTEFKKKSEFFIIPTKDKLKSLLENQLKIEVIGDNQVRRKSSMSGDEITFTFDDKTMSENFYAAFSRAVNLCKEK